MCTGASGSCSTTFWRVCLPGWPCEGWYGISPEGPRMSGRWLLILLCVLSCAAVRASELPTTPAQIRLASEEWSDYTAADGHGLAWDVLRAVFEPAAVTLQIRTVPYTRSVGLVQRGEVDAWVGSY